MEIAINCALHDSDGAMKQWNDDTYILDIGYSIALDILTILATAHDRYRSEHDDG